MTFILFFILVLNVVAIVLTYHCLTNMEQKDKIVFIAVGIAIIYGLTSFVYWISTKDIAIKEVSETGKNYITFLFVPINSLIVLPLIAKSYDKYKMGYLAKDKLRNRIIVLGIILIIVLVWERSYFSDIQNSIISQIEQENIKRNEVTNTIVTNEESNTQISNTLS